MIAQLINFAVVMIVLWVFALKPLKKLMDERGATIAGGLENAKKQEELLANAQKEYEAMIAKANGEAVVKMQEVKKDAEAKGTQMMQQIQAEATAAREANKKQLEADKSKMLEEVKKEAVAFVLSATEKALGSAVTEKVDSKLVEESIKQI